MSLLSQTQISARSGVPLSTLNQLVGRQAMPGPDIRAGREGFYSEELAALVVKWLKTQYVPHKRGQKMTYNREMK